MREATAETEMGILTDQASWYRCRDGGGMNMGQGATLEWSLEGYEPIWDVVAFGDAQGTQGNGSRAMRCQVRHLTASGALP